MQNTPSVLCHRTPHTCLPPRFNSYASFKAPGLVLPSCQPPVAFFLSNPFSLPPAGQEGRLLTTVEGHPLVSLLGAQDRAAIVEGTLKVSEGNGPWGTVLRTKTRRPDAGRAQGSPGEPGREAGVFGGTRRELEASRHPWGPREVTELTGKWQRRYSWVSPQHVSNLGNLRGTRWAE